MTYAEKSQVQRDRIRVNARRRYHENPWKIRQQSKEWIRNNPDRKARSRKLWMEKNRERMREYHRLYMRRYYALNKDKICKLWRKHRATDPAASSEYRRLMRAARSIEQREKDRHRNSAVMRSNVQLRIRRNLSVRLAHILRGTEKSQPFMKLLGCAIEEFRLYVESRFEIGMNWGNYGRRNDQWSLDHIVPCALFDLTKKEHQKRCFHFSNYTPMWHLENIAKGKKSVGQFQLL